MKKVLCKLFWRLREDFGKEKLNKKKNLPDKTVGNGHASKKKPHDKKNVGAPENKIITLTFESSYSFIWLG